MSLREKRIKKYCRVNIGTQSVHQTGVIIFSFDIKLFCVRRFVLTADVIYNSLSYNGRGRYMEKSRCRYFLSDFFYRHLFLPNGNSLGQLFLIYRIW